MVCFYKLWVLMHTPISGEIIEEFSKFSYERITGKGDFKSSEGCLEKFKKWFGPSLYNVLTTKHDTSFKTQIITQRIKKHKGRQYDQEIKGNKLERHCFFTCKCLGKRSRKKKAKWAEENGMSMCDILVLKWLQEKLLQVLLKTERKFGRRKKKSQFSFLWFRII